ncbi:hypothetical protein ABZY02_34330 [Streptomyces sp. NPDC006649]|uniref:hypothetical protein n=1 Tax=Streptomyces sp. NPDC006649 TaxID=3156896 RepID=UPI00339DDB7B
MNTQDSEVDEAGGITRGKAPAGAVTVFRDMVYGGSLVHSLDYVVLLHLLFATAEGRTLTPPQLWAELKDQGIRSAKNTKVLVGRDAVYEAFGRLIEAGYVHRVQSGAPGKFGKVSYEVYENPAWNPAREASPDAEEPQQGRISALASSQVSPLPGTPETEAALDGLARVSAGQPASRNAGSGNAGSGVPGSGARRVSAGQSASGVPGSGNAAPPTPPHREEEDSSSRKSSSTTAVTPSASTSAVTAEFLAELPGRWACGRRTAAEFAPLLADAVQTQGWELGRDLVQQLTRRAPARRSITTVLRDRIEDLPRYRAARRDLEQDRARSAAGQVPGQQLALEDQPEHQEPAPLPEGVSPERVEEARAFLLTLTGPWALGPQTAKRLAPLLASVSAERGWAFDERLRQQLMANPGGGQNYEWLLENRRIATLPDRTRKASATRPAVKTGMCPRHPYFRADDCSSCVVIKRKQERAAAAAAAAASNAAEAAPAAAEGQVPADVAAYVQGLAAGAAAEEAARRSKPVLTDWEQQHLAEQAEHALRLEAHDAALNA